MAVARAEMALSWPKTMVLMSRSRLRSDSRSLTETLFWGIRAIMATTFSTSLTETVLRRLLAGISMREAPTSSITSMALSGSLRSLM